MIEKVIRGIAASTIATLALSWLRWHGPRYPFDSGIIVPSVIHHLQGCNGDEYDGDNLLAIKCPSIVSPSSKEGSARSSSSSTSSCPPAQLMTRKTGPSSFAYFHLQHFPNFTKPRFSIFPLDKIRDDLPKYPGNGWFFCRGPASRGVFVILLEGCKHGFWAALLYTTSMASKKDKMPPSYNSTPPPLKGFSDVSSRNKSQICFTRPTWHLGPSL